MRYGQVRPEDIARLAVKADRAGQLGLACALFSLAGTLDLAHPYRLPSAYPVGDRIRQGLALVGDLPRRGRPPRPGAIDP
jgi:hypothetical protein